MKQTQALEKLKSGENVFLTGEAGAGKTYTINLFIEWAIENKKNFAITASTGIAATHIDGSTIHSWAALGIKKNLKSQDLQYIQRNENAMNRMLGVEILVIDEVSMLGGETIDDLNKVLQMVHRNSVAFGGIQVVFVGDFFQLPPVTRGSQQTVFAFQSQAWIDAALQVCYLSEQHRQEDPVFLDILTAMRKGTLTEKQKEIITNSKLDKKPDTQLFTHNVDVDVLNATELAKLPGKEFEFLMSESGIPALVKTLKRGCLSPEKLMLKEGAIVMFTRNNFDRGYVNGSVGKIISLSYDKILVELNNGEVVSPEFVEWKFRQGRETKATIGQIPLRLAWAITVHKSQGMSLDTAEVDLSKVFEFGQGYVAISRVRSLEGLHVSGINEQAFQMHPVVAAQDVLFRQEHLF